jgi:hypothetical protein
MKNKYMVSSLNEFGFCDYFDNPLDVEIPPIQTSITKSEAIERIKYFISQNTSETGVNNPSEISIDKISVDTGYEGNIYWHSSTFNQKLDTIEVINTKIFIHRLNGEPYICVGNWYPEIYVPKAFNFNQSEAKAVLIGKKVSHITFGGDEYFVTISKTNLEKSSITLKILPIETVDNIEIRVCWLIDIPVPVLL